jgi:hypothetical protein
MARKSLSAGILVALVWMAGCAATAPTPFPSPSPPRPTFATPPSAAATLWVVNETRGWLDVYLDDELECELAADEKCMIDSIRPGNHMLLLVRADGTTWQSPYDYSDEEMVSCFANRRDVDCVSDFDSLF